MDGELESVSQWAMGWWNCPTFPIGSLNSNNVWGKGSGYLLCRDQMKWTPASLQSRKLNLNCLEFASQHLSPSRLETMEFTAAPVTKEIKWAEAWWYHQRPRLEHPKVTETESWFCFTIWGQSDWNRKHLPKDTHLDGHAWGHPYTKLSTVHRWQLSPGDSFRDGREPL